MGNNILKKIVSNIPATNGNGSIIPSNIRANLEKIGEKGGQRYSDLVDKIVDLIFKK